MTIHDDGTVEVSIDIAARPETIFRYFKDPERFSRWVQADVEVDPEPGGELAVSFRQLGNRAVGKIVEIVENERIVFNWGMAPGCPDAGRLPAGSTTITIELQPHARGTRVTLRHEGLIDELRRDHESGWSYYLSQLSPLASTEHYATLLEPTIDAFIAAWNETDPATRSAGLARSFADDGVYFGAYGVMHGRDALAAHIAATQKFAPGCIVRRCGPVRLAHGHSSHAWEIARRDGVVLRGTDFAELDLDGRIVRLVSFPEPAA